MTGKHRHPEYQRNARVIRARAKAQLRHGNPVRCWRCGGAILPGSSFDVGHIDPGGGHGMHNLAPEHRMRAGGCRGNRAVGGADGAAIRNARRQGQRAGDVEQWPI